MAELNVQPKKKSSILPWILLLLGIAALIWFLTRDKDGKDVADASTTGVEATTTATDAAAGTTGAAAGAAGAAVANSTTNWDGIDFNAPSVNYDEITDKNINVRGNEGYGIYGLNETILFDEGKATIRTNAEANLKQIAGSIAKRYNGGEIRVYGYTDAQGSAGSNKELAQQRADAVKAWMQSNGVDAARISVNAIGEAQPAATNNTEAGRQQNRRVEIVARTTGK